jgi:hypothetical protein
MLSAQVTTFTGAPTPEDGVFIFHENNLFFLFHGTKAHAEKVLNNFTKINFKKPITDLQDFLNHEVKEKFKPNVVVAGVIKGILYAGRAGNMNLFVKREGKSYPLFKEEDAIKTLSGVIQPNDTYIFTTSVSHKLIDEERNALTEKINSSENPQKLGLMFLDYSDNVDTHVETIKETNKETIEDKTPKTSRVTNIAKNIIGSLFTFIAKINIKIIKFAAGAVAIILIGVVVFNIINGFVQKARARVATEMKKVEELQTNLGKAKNLLDLNNVRAEEIAKITLDEIKKIDLNKLASTDNRKKIEEIKNQLEQTLKTAGQVQETKAQLAYSTTLLKKNSAASQIVINNNQAAILDAKQNLVYYVTLDSKKANVFDLGKFGKNPRFLTESENMIYVFYDSAIVQIDPTNNKIKTALTKDKEWKDIVDLQSYSGNLYLLDATAKQIWKYVREDGGFALIKPYFAPALTKKPLSFAIDRAVYVLSEDNQINKFLSGEPDKFDMPKITDKPFKNPTKILTHDNLENVYALEGGLKRIVMLDKTGKYLKQIVDHKLMNAKTFGVNEKTKTIYFSLGSEIYKISY